LSIQHPGERFDRGERAAVPWPAEDIAGAAGRRPPPVAAAVRAAAPCFAVELQAKGPGRRDGRGPPNHSIGAASIVAEAEADRWQRIIDRRQVVDRRRGVIVAGSAVDIDAPVPVPAARRVPGPVTPFPSRLSWRQPSAAAGVSGSAAAATATAATAAAWKILRAQALCLIALPFGRVAPGLCRAGPPVLFIHSPYTFGLWRSGGVLVLCGRECDEHSEARTALALAALARREYTPSIIAKARNLGSAR
jgi:hypothetical protein